MSERSLNVTQLAQEFDRAFAEPPAAAHAELRDVLAVRIRDRAFAVLLGDLSGIYAGRSVTAVPTRLGQLLGLAAFRGNVVPVYDLGALLGQSRVESPRWLLLAAAKPLALAVDELEGHWRVPLSHILHEHGAGDGDRHVRGLVRAESGATRPLLDIGAVLETIHALVQRSQRAKEL